MRNLIEVIDRMLAAIPDDQDALRYDFKKLQESVSYSAPELMGLRWRSGTSILASSFPKKIEDFNEWQQKVIEIWSTKTFADLIEQEPVDKSL